MSESFNNNNLLWLYLQKNHIVQLIFFLSLITKFISSIHKFS